MEFHFNINDVFKQHITEIDQNLLPPTFSGDKRALWDTVQKITQVVNAMGEASAKAQSLPKAITTTDRLRNSDNKLYFMVDQGANKGNGAVTGMLKTGKKALYVFDKEGQYYQVSPRCILDFYVPESRQRCGYGKVLFQHMLENENISPMNMAIDRPSQKLLNFLDRHYSLKEPIKQRNNFVVYNGFFPNSSEPKEAGDSAEKGKLTANGLQYLSSSSKYYTQPVCSMEQMKQNQQYQPPVNSQSVPATQGQHSNMQQYANEGYTTQSAPNITYGNRGEQMQNIENQQQNSLALQQNYVYQQQQQQQQQAYPCQQDGNITEQSNDMKQNYPQQTQQVYSENIQQQSNQYNPQQNYAYAQNQAQNYMTEQQAISNTNQYYPQEQMQQIPSPMQTTLNVQQAHVQNYSSSRPASAVNVQPSGMQQHPQANQMYYPPQVSTGNIPVKSTKDRLFPSTQPHISGGRPVIQSASQPITSTDNQNIHAKHPIVQSQPNITIPANQAIYVDHTMQNLSGQVVSNPQMAQQAGYSTPQMTTSGMNMIPQQQNPYTSAITLNQQAAVNQSMADIAYQPPHPNIVGMNIPNQQYNVPIQNTNMQRYAPSDKMNAMQNYNQQNANVAPHQYIPDTTGQDVNNVPSMAPMQYNLGDKVSAGQVSNNPAGVISQQYIPSNKVPSGLVSYDPASVPPQYYNTNQNQANPTPVMRQQYTLSDKAQVLQTSANPQYYNVSDEVPMTQQTPSMAQEQYNMVNNDPSSQAQQYISDKTNASQISNSPMHGQNNAGDNNMNQTNQHVNAGENAQVIPQQLQNNAGDMVSSQQDIPEQNIQPSVNQQQKGKVSMGASDRPGVKQEKTDGIDRIAKRMMSDPNEGHGKTNITNEGVLRYGYPAQKPRNQVASFI